MKQDYIINAFVSALILINASVMSAQNSWAMAILEEGKSWPSFSEYRCSTETGTNGKDYQRIYDWGFRIRNEYYNPIQLPYGYRMSDRCIFIYDFEKNEERLAFDFTLSVDDHITTYNGIEWEVDEAKDSLVNTSYQGKGESTIKRLLKVHSIDGRYTDQWLEDFGSMTNHFMILPIEKSAQIWTLWMEYDEGHYLVREISSDPLFTYDSGTPERGTDSDEGELTITCKYNDGNLLIEYAGYHSPNRQFTCFYRVADDFYSAFVWELNPATSLAYVVWHQYTALFEGLPVPQSGNYIVHLNKKDRPLDITSAPIVHRTFAPRTYYDLSGRRLATPPTHGIYILNGKKVVK